MLIKSRKPGPKAKLLDLPIIPYGTEYKRFAFPLFYRVCVYYFRRSDVEMLAKMVHGDVNKHMEQKAAERQVRRQRARTKRVRSFKIEYHRGEFETSTDAIAELHSNSMSGPSLINKITELTVIQGWKNCWLSIRTKKSMRVTNSDVATTSAITTSACVTLAVTCRGAAMSRVGIANPYSETAGTSEY